MEDGVFLPSYIRNLTNPLQESLSTNKFNEIWQGFERCSFSLRNACYACTGPTLALSLQVFEARSLTDTSNRHVNYLPFIISFVQNKIESLPLLISNKISLAVFILLIPTYSPFYS